VSERNRVLAQSNQICRILVESAAEIEIEIHWNHKLTALEELEDTVRVTFDNGATDTGSFVVGCDGLHSKTRIELFGHEKAEYTGLTQVRI
jgi:salicylate hydroxylase